MKHLCPRCRKELIKSSVDGYTWECVDCDEDFFDFEAWTNDQDFTKLERLSIELAKEWGYVTE